MVLFQRCCGGIPVLKQLGILLLPVCLGKGWGAEVHPTLRAHQQVAARIGRGEGDEIWCFFNEITAVFRC